MHKTAKEAKLAGDKRYFTGKACINGHVSDRYVCNRECVVCDADRRARRRGKDSVQVTRMVRTVRVVKFAPNGNRFGYRKFKSVILDDKRSVVIGV